ncbi:MAG TPA: DnaB-like helicase C-terminal domain-containing protein [Vicinamibacteria bacterium]|nr:DnaB-like helicase C-terminal domain-containing protein [Vicinamibacteria bacterium]
MAQNQGPSETIGAEELRSLETSVLKTLCLTINTAGSELKYKILDSLSDEDFYFPVNKAVFLTLSEMHLRGDYVISANLEEELQKTFADLPSSLAIEQLFNGSLPSLGDLNGWVGRLRERSRSGIVPSVTPGGPTRSVPSEPTFHQKIGTTMVRSVEEVRKRIDDEYRRSSDSAVAVPPAASSSPPEPSEFPEPVLIDPPSSAPSITAPRASQPAPAPTSQAQSSHQPVEDSLLSSEGDDWSSYLDQIASQQGRTFDTGFARIDEGLGGLGPGLVLLSDGDNRRQADFLKQLTDQMAAGTELRCLYLAATRPKTQLRIRTLARLAAVPVDDIEKGRLKKDSQEWQRIEAAGRNAAAWLKRVFVYEVKGRLDIQLVRELLKKLRLLQGSTESSCLLVVDALERISSRDSTSSIASQLRTLATSMDVLAVAATGDPKTITARDADYVGIFREDETGRLELEVLQSGRESSTMVEFQYESRTCRFTEV